MTFYDAPHITNATGRFTVITQTRLHTWIFQSIADIVDRCCVVFNSGHGRFKIRSDLVHTNQKYEIDEREKELRIKLTK